MAILFFFLSVFSLSPIFARGTHLELEMPSRDYSRLLEKTQLEEDSLTPILEMGKRLLDWIILINKPLPEGKKISLYTYETEMAFPIESPRLSNPAIIQEIFSDLKTKMPDWMREVVLKGGPLTETLPVSEEEFIQWGLEVDRLYQRAARWKLQESELAEYAKEKKNDVRGYYYLSKEKDLKNKLNAWNCLSEEEKAQYRNWLTGLCFHSESSEAFCLAKVKSLETTPEKLYDFYEKYLSSGKKLWEEFFFLAGKRKDVEWQQTNLMKVPFRTPSLSVIQDFLTKNIEDEWRWGDWQLRLDFTSSALTHIEFQAGSTPHVNGIAGNTITMDANAPLTEYDVQWTIRHEYGHVLGFTDCYVEFYDTAQKIMVSYQLDTTNLMCSRKGKLKQTHFDELKKTYF